MSKATKYCYSHMCHLQLKTDHLQLKKPIVNMKIPCIVILFITNLKINIKISKKGLQALLSLLLFSLSFVLLTTYINNLKPMVVHCHLLHPTFKGQKKSYFHYFLYLKHYKKMKKYIVVPHPKSTLIIPNKQVQQEDIPLPPPKLSLTPSPTSFQKTFLVFSS